MAPALPCDDFSLIVLICIFTHLLENKKSRQLHGPRSEPGKEWGSFGALHPLYAAPVMGAGKTAEKWQKKHSWVLTVPRVRRGVNGGKMGSEKTPVGRGG